MDHAEDPSLPAWMDALLADVGRAFAVTGAHTPGWPDPHPDRRPLEEEYSRVTDVGKYRILHSRVDAWVKTLTEAGIAEARDVPAEPWIAACRPQDDHQRVRRLEPGRPDSLRVLLATTLVGGEPFGLDIGVCRSAEPPVFLARTPDCGCDACDSGSDDLLHELDDCVLVVVRGGVVHARRRDQSVTRNLHGWSSANGGERWWLDESAPAPRGVERWAGAPWG